MKFKAKAFLYHIVGWLVGPPMVRVHFHYQDCNEEITSDIRAKVLFTVSDPYADFSKNTRVPYVETDTDPLSSHYKVTWPSQMVAQEFGVLSKQIKLCIQDPEEFLVRTIIREGYEVNPVIKNWYQDEKGYLVKTELSPKYAYRITYHQILGIAETSE